MKLIMAAIMGVTIALAGCTKADQAKTDADIKAAADTVADKAKEAAGSPEVKQVGSEIKEAAGDVGTVVKETAKGAVQGAKEGAREGKAKADADNK